MERDGAGMFLLVFAGAAALAGCGRTGVGLADEGAGRSWAGGGRAGTAGVMAGATAGVPTAGSASGGASSGVGGGHSIVTCDRDGDGYQSTDCEGNDCNDGDRSIHPGAPDTNAVAGAWREEYAFGEIPGNSRGFTSIAVDGAGVAHVVEGQEGLRYANNALEWKSEIIDENSTGTPSLTLSPDGSVNIAYVTSDEVRLATRSRLGWATERILTLNPGAPAYAGACSIASDREGRLHLVFRGGDALQYATLAGGVWTVITATSANREPIPALAIDALGAPHFVFGAGGGNDEALLYATRCGASVCVERVAPGIALDADVAVDDRGVVHVVYGMNVSIAPLRYAVRSPDGTWLEETIVQGSSWGVDLAAGPGGGAESLRLAFLGGPGSSSSFDVSYARRGNDAWLTERVAPHGYGVSLALEGANVAHIARTDFRFDVHTYVAYHTNRELAPDGIDQNCDGMDGVDADGDGFAAPSTGGTDCDDGDASVHRLSVDALGCEVSGE
jgi:hypothetical protein